MLSTCKFCHTQIFLFTDDPESVWVKSSGGHAVNVCPENPEYDHLPED